MFILNSASFWKNGKLVMEDTGCRKTRIFLLWNLLFDRLKSPTLAQTRRDRGETGLHAPR